MIDEILVCLDGSSWAEKTLPLAKGIARAAGARLVFLRVVEDADELAAEENYMREEASRFRAQVRFVVSQDPVSAIRAELKANSGAIAVMTTHGRTAWTEAILGSVALKLIRTSRRPVILCRPLRHDRDLPTRIGTILLALDGSEFSERMIPFAVEMARSLSARLQLIQALPLHPQIPTAPGQAQSDVLESSYLHRKAAEIKSTYAIDCDFEVVHGEPAEAICRYVEGMAETMLALTSHARGGLERAIFGSVAAACVRNAGVPILIYWPPS
jgi:nucleotide-binding universal stress UspA family protein